MKKVLTIAFMFLSVLSWAQLRPVASATIDRDSIRVGEHITLDLSVEYDIDIDSAKVGWPQYEETITDHLEIVRKGNRSTEPGITGNTAVQREQWVITSFDSGDFVLPPMVYAFETDTAYTDPILIYSTTVQVDTSKAIMDIKEIFDVDLGFWEEWKWWIITAASALALLGLLFWWSKRPVKAKEIEVEESTPMTMHQMMLKRLRELEAEGLWQKGEVKAYYIGISTIIREYVQERYGINAMEKTSDELLDVLRHEDIDYEARRKLRHILLLSDMVKFAREEPMASENEQAVREAMEFITATQRSTEPTFEVNLGAR